jgi:hypothetical protein
MHIMEKHPEWNVVVLVRSKEQKDVVLARWPKIEVVIGDLDDKEFLIKEGSKADVVLRMYLLLWRVQRPCCRISVLTKSAQKLHRQIIFRAPWLSLKASAKRSLNQATSSMSAERE